MITTALFDIDGVVTTKRQELHSERFIREYHAPGEEVKAFFVQEFPACLTGDADLKQVISPYLKKWNWNGSVEDFLQYWFMSEPGIDERVIGMIEKLRDMTIECYLASEQEKYRAAYLLRLGGLVDKVDGAYFTSVLGVRKKSTEFYEKILKRLSVPAEEVVFWDDDELNVVAAKQTGITAYFYTEFALFKKQVQEILSRNKK
jgi:putative hydrolase of the HAD superfamily